jgi:cellulose synthase/poly-beta-1,6-N-acetylglucosamine synthase-like glycosyltransferase
MLSASVPRVSVVMAVRNGMPFLVPAVDSVRRQTLTDWELILVDDGSSDGGPEAISRLGDERIRLVRQEPRGLGAALNAGIACARSPYVARLDADDLAYPRRLEMQVRYLDWRSDCGVVGGWYEVINEDGVAKGMMRHPTDDASLRWRLLKGNPLAHSTVVVRREVLEALGGYDEALTYAEDFDLWTRLAREWRLGQIAVCVGAWRDQPGSMTATRIAARRQAVASIAARSLSCAAGYAVSERIAALVIGALSAGSASADELSEAVRVVDEALARTCAQWARSPADRSALFRAWRRDRARLVAGTACTVRAIACTVGRGLHLSPTDLATSEQAVCVARALRGAGSGGRLRRRAT